MQFVVHADVERRLLLAELAELNASEPTTEQVVTQLRQIRFSKMEGTSRADRMRSPELESKGESDHESRS